MCISLILSMLGSRSALFWASWIRICSLEIRIGILPFTHKGVEWTEIMLEKLNFNTLHFSMKIVCLRVSYKKKIWKKWRKNFLFASLKSLKKGVGSGVGSGSGSGSVSQKCWSADPDLHQNVTDPRHCIWEPESFMTMLPLRALKSHRKETGTKQSHFSLPGVTRSVGGGGGGF